MEDENGASLPDLKTDLIENGSEFNFFQAYRILQRLNDRAQSGRFDLRDIRVRPNLELGYGDTDIHEVLELDRNKGYEIVTNLAGLYGISSPLPDFYTEQLLDAEWEGLEGPRAFLDIIHHQLLAKLYEAWRLYRLGQNTVEDRRKSYHRLLGSLTNNPALGVSIDDEMARHKLQFSGIYSLYSKSALGLKSLVQTFVNTADVHIEQNRPRVVRIPERDRLRLGATATVLGQDAHLGSHIADRQGAIRIRIGPLREDQYREQFLDETRFGQLRRLITEYLLEPLAVQFELLLDVQEAGTCLGERWNRLGSTAYLANPKQSSLIRTYFDL